MFFNYRKKIYIVFLGISFFLIGLFNVSFADFDFEICESIDKIDQKCQTLSESECREILEKCDDYFEQRTAEIEEDISKTEQEKATLQNQISNLRREIQNLDYQIYQGNLTIRDLSLRVSETQSSIDKISFKIEDSRNQLKNILREIYKEEEKSLVEVSLAGGFSDFFDNLTNLESLNSRLQGILKNTENLKNHLEGKEEEISGEKESLEKTTAMRELQKQESARARQEREHLLRMTETQYQEHLREKEEAERKAAEIRDRLFRLVGIPDVEAPTFDEAIQIAQDVSSVVGVRPAFLLGVISAESALGRNVGQCYVTDSETGGGEYQNGQPLSRIMHPDRDLPIFLDIVGENYSEVPVSCWIKICVNRNWHLVYNNITVTSDGSIQCPSGYSPFGWGGAMGPAQFIPSTWRSYESKIRSTFGISNPDPWNVRHAFSASSFYLADLGAAQRTYNAERNAANRYSGGYAWYADQVMRRASCIQEFIDKETMSSDCERLILPNN